jgi:hypothetical protein
MKEISEEERGMGRECTSIRIETVMKESGWMTGE